MSRSALQKDFLKKQSQVAAPVPPPELLLQQQQYYMQYQAQQAAMMGMPNMMVGMVDPSAFVPIPLTGDEEDNDEHAAVSNVLPMNGNSTNYNINNLLFNNIMENEYFRALYQLRTYHEVIDEIYRSVDHVEPWQTGTARLPSSAFCLLVKFMLMKLTLKQMKGLLNTTDCANLRAIGLLYLRYTCPPADLWKWYEPFLEDPEEFSPGADQTVKMTVGEYCVKLLMDMQYYGTTLPRIPVPIERKMKVMLLLLEEKKKRRRANARDKERGLFCKGAKVRAIYSDEANEPAWYEAVIDSVDEEGSSEGSALFWVTFPEYGNTEKVDLGDMELLGGAGKDAAEEDRREEARRSTSNNRDHKDGRSDRGAGGGERDRRDDRGGGRDSYSRSRSRDRGGRRSPERRDNRDNRGRDRDSRDRGGSTRGGGGGRDRDSRDRKRDRSPSRDSRDRRDNRGDRDRDNGPRDGLSSAGGSTTNLLEKVLASQREASAAVGKNYGQRPASYKGSLSLKFDRFTTRRKSPSPERRRRRSRSRSPPRGGGQGRDGGRDGRDNTTSTSASGASSGVSSAAAAEKLRQMKLLKERYGDASATTK